MADDLPEKIRWDADFRRRVYGGVVSGLIVLMIAALAGLAFTQVASLSTGDALLYIGLPVVVLVVLTLSVVVARAALQRGRDRTEWEAEISHLLLQSVDVIRRMLLSDLIHTVQVWEWEVFEDEDRDLVFVSPGEVRVLVEEQYPLMEDVARRLQEADPDHFPEAWNDFTYRALVAAETAAAEIEEVRVELASLDVRIAKAALARVLSSAERAGWEVSWLEDHAVFERDGEKVTVDYDEVDTDKLQAVLDLNRA